MEKDHGRHVVGGRIKVGELQVGAGSCGIASSVACSGIKASPGKALSNAGRIHRYHLLHLPRESHYPGLLITLPVVLGGGGGRGEEGGGGASKDVVLRQWVVFTSGMAWTTGSAV